MPFLSNARSRAALATASLLIAGTFAAPALAGSALQVSAPSLTEVTRSTSINFHDLNLADQGGAEKARNRVERAAARVCGYNSMWGIRPSEDYVACYDSALENALPKLDRAVAAAVDRRQQSAMNTIR